MKKVTVLFLTMAMMICMTSCGNQGSKGEADSVGAVLLQDFKADTKGTVLEIAERLATNTIIPFAGAAMEVEPGFLTGFDNAEITGFESGAMFGPMMGTIPFVGYVFDLDENTDVETFIKTLKEQANLRWNICTEAEELTVDYADDKIFFLMSPEEFTEEVE